MNAESDSKQIQEISRRLFRDNGASGHFVEDERQLESVVTNYLKPDVVFSPKTPEIGFIHRQLSAGNLYFIANTGNQPRSVLAKFRESARYAEWWDPFTGQTSPVENAATIEVSLQPYESRIIFFFTNSGVKPEPEWISDPHSTVMDLSTDWTLTFGRLNRTIHMAALHSWSEEEPFKYYSGQVTYEKAIDIPADLKSETTLVLEFGGGTPVAKPDPLPAFNMRAFLEGPLREAGEVYVNGQRAGVVWHPPYIIDLSSFLKAGKNELRIVVGNTAINSLAGQALPDYRLLNDRYGERFVPQGMDNLQPLPSGLLAAPRLRVTLRHRSARDRSARDRSARDRSAK